MTKTEFKKGDRIVWNGGAGTFLRYQDGHYSDHKGHTVGVMKMDRDKDNDIEQEDLPEYIEPFQAYELDEVAIIETDPHIGFGHVITEDGTIYTLRKQYAHGIICAILFPETAIKHGIGAPAKGAANVFEYQRFEIDCQHELPVIRISSGWSGVNISKGRKKATPQQIDSTRRCLLAAGLSLADDVETEEGQCTMRSLMKRLEYGDE